VRIATSEKFVDAFAYLRAVLKTGETSERTFELTTICIHLNPANYTVWEYRRAILKALKKDLRDEFTFSEEIIVENSKNYQVWHHRYVLVKWTGDASDERRFTSLILEDDCKNYHAWQHRQSIVAQFNLIGDEEVIFSSKCLAEDFRNNSAWNYRFFIISSMDGYSNPVILEREILFTQEVIRKAPNNESPWNYLSGILLNEGVSSRSDLLDFCQSIRRFPGRPSPYCLAFLVDAYVELVEKKENVKENSESAFELLKELETIDATRVKYWKYQRHLLENLIAAQ